MSKFQALSDCYENPMSKDEVRARLKELAKKDIVKLKKDIVEYNLMREKIIMEMENNPDPEFRNQLAMFKKTLGPRALDHIEELPKVEENSEDDS